MPMTSVHAPRRLVIASGGSALSRWHAAHVRARLESLYRHAAIDLLDVPGHAMEDRIPPHAGGKGSRVRELEQAMQEGRADFAVHALKDLPMQVADGFVIAAVPAREDPRDAFVSNRAHALDQLSPGAVVGTSSLRRSAQIRERYAALRVQAMDGSAASRLKTLDEGRCDALVMSVAGLKRLGLADRIAGLLDPDESLPAPGQGALALECRTDRPDVAAALAPLADTSATLATIAERAFARALSGHCRTALAAYAEWIGERLWLRGLLASHDGSDVMRDEIDGIVDDGASANALGEALADEFLADGAARLVAA